MSNPTLSTADVVKRVAPHIFLVSATECDGDKCRGSAGSLFALRHRTLGVVGVTAAHVLLRSGVKAKPVDEFTLTDAYNKGTFEARILAISPATDTAFVQFLEPRAEGLVLEERELQVGLPIVCVGNDAAIPLHMGGGPVVKQGNISGIRFAPNPVMTETGLHFPADARKVQWIQGGIPIVGGASGAPWVSAETCGVVGVCSWGLQDTGSDNFAVGPITLNEELDKLAGTPLVKRRGLIELSSGVQVARNVEGTSLFVFKRSGARGRGGLIRPPRLRDQLSYLCNPLRALVRMKKKGKPQHRVDPRYYTLIGVEGKKVSKLDDIPAAVNGAVPGECIDFQFAWSDGTPFNWVLPISADALRQPR